MKPVKFFILLAVLAFSSGVLASNDDPKGDKAIKEALTKEITSFFKKTQHSYR